MMTMQDDKQFTNSDEQVLKVEDVVEVEESKEEYHDTLEFDNAVVEKVVGILAKEVQGILGMKGSFISDITQTFTSGDDITKGITAEVNGKDVAVDMKVILEYGVSAPKIFEEVKRKIREGLLAMTGLSLRELNVRVVDVMTRKAYEDASRKSNERARQQQEQYAQANQMQGY